MVGRQSRECQHSREQAAALGLHSDLSSGIPRCRIQASARI
jgi:hypothetical protein